MNCDEARKRLLDALYEGVRDAEVARHLEGCPSCREARDRFAETIEMLGPPGALERVPEGLYRRIERAVRPPLRARVFTAAVLAAAACLVVVGRRAFHARERVVERAPKAPGLTRHAESALWRRYERPRLQAKRYRAASQPIFNEPLEKALDRAAPLRVRRSARRILSNVWEKWPSKV